MHSFPMNAIFSTQITKQISTDWGWFIEIKDPVQGRLELQVALYCMWAQAHWKQNVNFRCRLIQKEKLSL